MKPTSGIQKTGTTKLMRGSRLEFRPLMPGDVNLLREYYAITKSQMCDYSIGATYMWKDYCKTEICLFKGTLCIKSFYFNNKISFSMPIGSNPMGAINEILSYCRDENMPAIFSPVSRSEMGMISENFTLADVASERNWYDYIYKASDIVTFKGKKFNGQRNHINKFRRLYPEYSFVELDESNLDEAVAFFMGFQNSNDNPIENEEFDKALYLLQNYRLFGASGGMLALNNKIIALSLGERLNGTLFIHVERCDKKFDGVCQMLVHEYAKHFVTPGISHINRLEDVGDEGLRRSKLSYHPEFLLEKFTVEIAT